MKSFQKQSLNSVTHVMPEKLQLDKYTFISTQLCHRTALMMGIHLSGNWANPIRKL
jgi:hypothetical protein